MLTINVTIKGRYNFGSSDFRHFASGPNAIPLTKIAVSGTNTALKNGGPTDTFPPPSASTKSGYSVPKRTLTAITVSTKLLNSKNDSREIQPNSPGSDTFPALSAYKINEPPITTTRNPRMKTPRSGSFANAWTDVNTPDRTKNVPSSDNEKAAIASNNVQLRNSPRFSVTASECIKAVATNHGINDAFSTGSQNHQPPQPSS